MNTIHTCRECGALFEHIAGDGLGRAPLYCPEHRDKRKSHKTWQEPKGARRGWTRQMEVQLRRMWDQGWNKTQICRALKVTRPTLDKKLKLLGLNRDSPPDVSESSTPDPIPLDELSADARRGAEEFLWFCTHFLENPKKRGERLQAPPYWREIAQTISDPSLPKLVITVHPGVGKALALDTPIKTPSGWTTMKELEVGDQVYDEGGQPCNITYKSPVFYDHDCYRVTSDDGASVIADGDHLWPVEVEGYQPSKHRGGKAKNGWGTSEYRASYPESPRFRLKTTRELVRPFYKKPRLPVTAAIDAPDQPLLVDPYVLGLWLGDGTTAQASFTMHEEDAPFLRSFIEEAGYETTNRKHPQSIGTRGLHRHLAALGVLGNKHIPENYLNGSAQQRLALLRGLVDSDGSVSKGGRVEFCSTLPNLAKGVQYLAHSLGVKATCVKGETHFNGVRHKDRYRVGFYLADAARLPRKAARCRNGFRTTSRYLTIERVESVPTQCISVDSPNSLYLAGEGLMVTHNTWCAVAYIMWRITRERALGNRGFSVLYGSGTEAIAAEALRLLNQWTSSPSLIAAYGRFRPEGDEEERTWNKRNIVVAGMGAGKGATLSIWTITGKIRGTRPDLMIWDDPQSAEESNPEQTAELVHKWDSEIEDRLEPGGKIALIGTYAGVTDLQHALLERKVVEEDGTERQEWIQIRFPAHDQSRCGGQGNHGQYPEGCLLWPERKSYRDMLPIMQNKEMIWRLQWQLEDVPGSEVLVPVDWIPDCLDDGREMWELPEELSEGAVMIGSLDPSPTQWSAFTLWVWDDPFDYLIAFERARVKSDEEYARVITQWTERGRSLMPFSTWVVERTGSIYLHQSREFQRLVANLGIDIITHETSRKTKHDQEHGMWSWRDQFRFKRARLPYAPGPTREMMKPFIDEHTRFPFYPTDDSPHSTWFYQFHKFSVRPPDLEPTRLWRPSWLLAESRSVSAR